MSQGPFNTRMGSFEALPDKHAPFWHTVLARTKMLLRYGIMPGVGWKRAVAIGFDHERSTLAIT